MATLTTSILTQQLLGEEVSSLVEISVAPAAVSNNALMAFAAQPQEEAQTHNRALMGFALNAPTVFAKQLAVLIC